MDNDGFAERTAWAAPTDGLLVMDMNGNGKIITFIFIANDNHKSNVIKPKVA